MDFWIKVIRRMAFPGIVIVIAAFWPGMVLGEGMVLKGEMTPENRFEVHGDSTLHAFQIGVNKYKVTLRIEPTDETEGLSPFECLRLGAPCHLEVIVDVKDLESGKNKLDEKMLETMNAAKFPAVRFNCRKGEIVEKDGEWIYRVTGILNISGVPQEVDLNLLVEPAGDGIRLKGIQDVRMSDHGLKPPVVMLGLLKTEDQVQVHMDWELKIEE